MFYYLSIGSAVEPEQNAALIVKQLCLSFGEIALFPLRYTEPENVSGIKIFINGLAVIYSENGHAGVKQQLVDIERTLGRDRENRPKVYRGWTADIDILGETTQFDAERFRSETTSYSRSVFELRGEIPDLSSRGLTSFSARASARIEKDTLIILEDSFRHFKNQSEYKKIKYEGAGMGSNVILRLEKQRFHFSAGHFTIFSATEREKLHGHNYYLSVEFGYNKDKVHFDYNSIKNDITELCNELDERILIPELSPHIRIEEGEKNTQVYFDNDEFSFPKDDVLVLPITNTTIEDMVVLLGQKLDQRFPDDFTTIIAELKSGPGQACRYTVREQ